MVIWEQHRKFTDKPTDDMNQAEREGEERDTEENRDRAVRKTR